MANFTPVRPIGTWINGAVVLSTEMNSFDVSLTKIWTGEGGAFVPGSPINVRGTLPLWLQGPTTFSTGALVVNLAASGSKFTFGDNDYFQLVNAHTGSTRLIEQDILQAVMSTDGTIRSDNGGLVALQPYAAGAYFYVPLRVHDGSTLVSALITFKVLDAHAGGVPQFMPRARVVQIQADGSKKPLGTPAGGNGSDINGWQSLAKPGSGGAWQAGAAAQTWLWIADAGTICDATKATILEVQDENGTNAYPNIWTSANHQNIWCSVRTSHTGIADMRPS